MMENLRRGNILCLPSLKIFFYVAEILRSACVADFLLQTFLHQNMHFWKIKSSLFCLKNLDLCDWQFYYPVNICFFKISPKLFLRQKCSKTFSKKQMFGIILFCFTLIKKKRRPINNCMISLGFFLSWQKGIQASRTLVHNLNGCELTAFSKCIFDGNFLLKVWEKVPYQF